MTSTDMNHMLHIDAIAESDCNVLRMKERSYKGSWKKTGGRSAWFQFERNMTRLQNMLAKPADAEGFSMADLDDCIQQAQMEDQDQDGTGDCTLDVSIVKFLRDCYVSENIFAKIRENPNGEDGTVLAALRDLRRYALLIEAEMISRGVVEPELEPGSNRPSAETLEPGKTLKLEPGERFDSPDKGWFVQNDSSETMWIDRDGKIALPTLPGLPPQKKFYTSDGFVIYTDQFYQYQEEDTGPPIAAKVIRFIGDQVYIDIGAIKVLTNPDRLIAMPGAFSPELLKAAETAPPATPEAGSQHETLTPWAVSTSWRYRKGFEPRTDKDTQFYTWWHNQAPGIFVLEPAVPETSGLPPGVIGHLYTKSGPFYVLLIGRCPPGARSWFPTLRRELNTKEKEEAPEWQRGMYVWSENGTKWIVYPQYEAWCEA